MPGDAITFAAALAADDWDEPIFFAPAGYAIVANVLVDGIADLQISIYDLHKRRHR